MCLNKTILDKDKTIVKSELEILNKKKIDTNAQIKLIKTKIKESKKQQRSQSKLSVLEKINLIKTL